MRRKDREIIDKYLIEEFISKEQIIRIAFYDNGDIYIVPVNYGYCCENGHYNFYFHGAKEGRKFELAKSSPLVGFEIDGGYQLIERERACNFSANFHSVIGTGILTIVNDYGEKIVGLNCIMEHITGKNSWNYDDFVINNVAVFKLNVDKMSCKAKNP